MDFLKDYIPGSFYRDDVKIQNKRHMVFATKEQLQLLKSAKTWYMDTSFNVGKKPFIQLYTMNAFLKKNREIKHVPLVFVMMSGEKKVDEV